MKTNCDECGERFPEAERFSPWAFPPVDMRFDENLRFCSERCLNIHDAKYVARHQKGVPKGAEKSKGSEGVSVYITFECDWCKAKQNVLVGRQDAGQLARAMPNGSNVK